ncbi:MAG: ABC transporter ATP-binding protein [Pseudomonadota bacterium]
MNPNDAFILIRDLRKEYRTRSAEKVLALEDVNLSISENEFVTVVGRSGCGKSTLLKLIAGILPASRGEISINGIPVSEPRKDVGMVFQSPVLLPWRNVIENILFPIEIMKLPAGEYQAKARSLLDLVGLSGFENKVPRELSGGMQQRVSICRSLIHDPNILLMDEPFGALDAMTRDELGLELTRIWQQEKKTVLFVTHSIPEAVFLGDRVIVMSPRPGRVVKVVPIHLTRPRSIDMEFTEEFKNYVLEIRESIYADS